MSRWVRATVLREELRDEPHTYQFLPDHASATLSYLSPIPRRGKFSWKILCALAALGCVLPVLPF